MTTAEADIHSPVLRRQFGYARRQMMAAAAYHGSEQQHRDHLVGMTANVRVLAAVLVRPPLSRTEAAERRS